MASGLYERKNYLFDYPFILSTPIYEYDITKANINILYRANAISKKEYDNLLLYSRMNRQVYIGCMIREYPEILTILNDGIIQAKKELFETNNVQDSEILSIKNDAVFIMGRQMQYTKFDNVEFLLKNKYSIFMKILGKEIYYGSDQIKGCDIIDVKGIADYKLELHANGMIVLISEILEQLEYGNLQEAVSMFNSYYDMYINLKLPVQYYRTFDSNSVFILGNGKTPFTVSELPGNFDLTQLNISYNMNFLRELYSYIAYIIFTTKRR